MNDYYKILGVSENATADEISKAFKKLALKYHPDRNKGDKDAEQKFKEINEAYSTLKDEESRRTYDNQRRFGSSGFGGFGGGGFRTGGFGPDMDDEFIRNIMRNYGMGNFNGFNFSRRPVGPDEHVRVDVLLKDLLTIKDFVVVAGRNNVKIKVHPQTTDGTTLRARGKAYCSSNAADPGDLFITINIIYPSGFYAVNSALHYKAQIDVVKSLKEPVEIVIPASESHDGQEVRFTVDNTNGGVLKSSTYLHGRGLYNIPNPFSGAVSRLPLYIDFEYVYNKE